MFCTEFEVLPVLVRIGILRCGGFSGRLFAQVLYEKSEEHGDKRGKHKAQEIIGCKTAALFFGQ